MSLLPSLLLLLLLLVLVSLSVVCSGEAAAYDNLHRGSFPSGFVFGTASSAYQYEGGAREDGRGSSIWDSFTHSNDDKILDGSNGDVAVNFYHLYKEDVKTMKEMGVDAFRFSISWSRILPNGSLSGVNREGIQFYNNLISELISNGLKPFVTLFHFDTPSGLEDQYGGFLSPLIVEDFRRYVDICFRAFGDRVKHWITLNEPLVYSTQGYASGVFAPGRCTPVVYGNCTAGDSGEEPYIVAHHQLLAHAAAVNLYRDKYQASQKGEIGIALATQWALPFSKSKEDIDAAERTLDFTNGWFLNPITYGDYPLSMRMLVGNRLPKFTKEQSRLMKGSFDFIGVNYYTTMYAYSEPSSQSVYKNYYTDYNAKLTGVRNGVPIGPVAASSWLYVYPPGVRDLLLYIKRKYNNPVIYITENGVDEVNNETLALEEALKDEMRIEYHGRHLLNVHKAIRKGVDVRGYFAWSLLDNFEWSSGYAVRFGIYYIDYKDGLKRYPKSSALWFQKLLKIEGRSG